MDKPKCKLCGFKHRSSEPHIWGDIPDSEKKEAPEEKVSQVEEKSPSEKSTYRKQVQITPGQEEMLAAYKKTLERRKYMREYMRQYRKEKG